jgi:quercetin dioxygenase-like cupin family protein
VRLHDDREQPAELRQSRAHAPLSLRGLYGGFDVAPDVIQLRLPQDVVLKSRRLLESLDELQQGIVAEIVDGYDLIGIHAASILPMPEAAYTEAGRGQAAYFNRGVVVSMADCPFCVISRRSLVTRALGAALAVGAGTRFAFAQKAIAQVPGLTSEQLAKGSVDYSEFVDGPADFYTLKLTFAPGSYIPWHTHPGPVWGIINSGTLTAYYDTLGCQTAFPTGTAVYVPRGLTHEEHNDGAGVLEVISTFILPAGSPTRIPADAPIGGVCYPTGPGPSTPTKP